MEDYLAIIRRVIEEHQTIRGHIKLVGDSIPDREALTSLEKARADWVPGQPTFLAEIQEKLQRVIMSLDEGIKNHFVYEEKVLPPLLGKLFMRALILDHREVTKEINEGKSVATGIRLEGLSREELLSKESQVQQTISSICRAVEEHLTKEETILEMLRAALEEKAQNKSY